MELKIWRTDFKKIDHKQNVLKIKWLIYFCMHYLEEDHLLFTCWNYFSPTLTSDLLKIEKQFLWKIVAKPYFNQIYCILLK